MTSINTNIYAMQALFGLDRANQQLGVAQKRVNTGYRVNDANDDGATFAIAQSVRGNINAYDAVIESLNRSKSTIKQMITNATMLSDLMVEAEPLFIKLLDNSLNATDKARIQQTLDGIYKIGMGGGTAQDLIDASFNGISLGQFFSTADWFSFTTSINGAQETINFSMGVDDFGSLFASNFSSSLDYGAIQPILGNFISQTVAYERRVDNLIKLNTTLRDAAEIGLGAMVDADLARESAKLQSAQIKQQMAIQSLGIANNSNRNVLALFGR